MFQTTRELREKYPKEEDFLSALREWQREHPIPTGSVRNVVDHIEHIQAQVTQIVVHRLGQLFRGASL